MSSPRFDVVGLGENSVDEVCRVGEWPGAGPASKLEIVQREVRLGGQVATALAACAALGLRAAYVGTFGNDRHGAALQRELQRRGIDTSGASVRPAPNRSAVVVVDQRNGDRVVLWHRDPALRLAPADLPGELITASRLLHVDDTDEEASLAAAAMARATGIPVTSDIGRVTSRTEALVAAVTVPILASHVPAALTGDADPERALRRLQRPGHALLCVTHGEEGALVLHGDRAYHAPACRVAAVDTTGAGDVFRGAFIDALLRGDEPAAILRFAAAAAAVSCTRAGAMDSVPTRQEIEALMAEPR